MREMRPSGRGKRGSMKALTEPLLELAEFEEGRFLLKKEGAGIGYTGCADSQKLHLVFGLSEDFLYKVIVTHSDLRAREIYEEYLFYDKSTVLYPARDLIFYQADIHGNQLVADRMKVLKRLIEGRPVTVVTTFAALMTPQVPFGMYFCASA